MNTSIIDQSANKIVLQTKGVIKQFAGIRVLDQIDFELREGEVHVIVGENGAGKSTFVKILTGIYAQDEGKIYVGGKEVHVHNRADATINGVGIVFQEFSLIPSLSIAENMFVGHLPKVAILGGLLKVIDWKTIHDMARKYLKDFNIDIDPSIKLKNCGVAIQQLVEIVKALILNTRILILDEPTATLSKYEIERLFGAIQELKRKKVSIIYISHRLNEVAIIGDRVTVLKDGQKVDTLNIPNTSPSDIIKLMIGRDISDVFPPKKRIRKSSVLRVERLTAGKMFQNVSFEVHEGEIIGITGLVGAGKTELANALFGIVRKTSGSISVGNRTVEIGSPLKATLSGLGLLPEDRKRNGIIGCLCIRENIGLPNLSKFMKYRIIMRKREIELIRHYMQMVDVRPSNPERKVRYLSGGNQQKVVLSKWLCSKSRLLIFDEPTRGIDVGAKLEIYRLMDDLAHSGCGIIMISSEIPEILGMADRIFVMHRGKVVREYSNEEATSESILQASIGSDTRI
jgi:ABC-type sugar transport system ATPase subunit